MVMLNNLTSTQRSCVFSFSSRECESLAKKLTRID